MARPSDVRLTLSNGVDIGFGEHLYDGAGNLVVRGPDYFLYERVSRLTRYQFSGGEYQTYGFDAFGNRDHITTYDGTTTLAQSFAMTRAKNQLQQARYDARGNMTGWGDVDLRWDEVDMVFQRGEVGGNDLWQTNVYTADDERVCTLYWQAGILSETWMLRDLDNQVLTVYGKPDSLGSTDWDWKRDDIHHPDGTMLLSVTDQPGALNRQHYATDHLGSPLITTDANGTIIQNESLWGFGASFRYTGERQDRKFTGHERDHHTNGVAFDLDYMHARHYSPHLGRFLSVDPANESVRFGAPQSWNRYAYTLGNPMKLVDPDGKAAVAAYSEEILERAREVRDGISERVSAIPVIGESAAKVVDFGMSLILPASKEEAQAQVEASLPGPMVAGRAARSAIVRISSAIKPSGRLIGNAGTSKKCEFSVEGSKERRACSKNLPRARN